MNYKTPMQVLGTLVQEGNSTVAFETESLWTIHGISSGEQARDRSEAKLTNLWDLCGDQLYYSRFKKNSFTLNFALLCKAAI